MKHNHHDDHGGDTGHCVCDGGMSYGKHCKTKWQDGKKPVKWSTCSKNDFTEYFYSNQKNWCMAPITTNFCGKSKKKICLIISELKSEI